MRKALELFRQHWRNSRTFCDYDFFLTLRRALHGEWQHESREEVISRWKRSGLLLEDL